MEAERGVEAPVVVLGRDDGALLGLGGVVQVVRFGQHLAVRANRTCLWNMRERDVAGMTDLWLENLGEWGTIRATESTVGRSNFFFFKIGSQGRKSRILLWTF